MENKVTVSWCDGEVDITRNDGTSGKVSSGVKAKSPSRFDFRGVRWPEFFQHSAPSFNHLSGLSISLFIHLDKLAFC